MSSESPLVSVIIPTYDRPQLLQRAVRSVVSQSYKNIEVIIVDDCPTNPAKNIIDSMSNKRIKYNLHSYNKGVCSARNTGIENADGKYICFLDDDDSWRKNKVQAQISVVENDSNIGFVYTGTRNVDDSGNTLTISTPQKEGNVTKRLLLGDFISFSSILVDQEVIEQAGRLNEDLPNWEDWEWCIRLSQYTNFGVVNQPYVTSYRGDHGKRSDNFEKKRDTGFERFVNEVMPTAAEYGNLFKRKFKSHAYYHLGRAALGNGYYMDARKELFTAIRLWPFNKKFYVYFTLSLLGDRGYTFAQEIKRNIIRMYE